MIWRLACWGLAALSVLAWAENELSYSDDAAVTIRRGKPEDERHGLEIEFNIPRTLGHFFRVLEIQPKSPTNKSIRRWLEPAQVDAYLDNPEAFQTLSPALQAELTQGLIEPKSSLQISEAKIEGSEALRTRSDSGLILSDSPPSQSFSLLGPDGKALTEEAQEAKEPPGENIIKQFSPLSSAGDTQLKKLNAAYGEKSHAGFLDITSTQKNALYWESIRDRWKKMKDPKKRSQINPNFLPGEIKAAYFLDHPFTPVVDLDFRKDLDSRTQEMLSDFEIDIDPLGAFELRYKGDHAIHGMDNHLARLQLIASLAGIQRYVNDPQLEPSLVFKNLIERNEKGFSVHTHTSSDTGDLVLVKEIHLLDFLVKLKALKKGGDPTRIGSGHIAYGPAAGVLRGINNFGKSFEWRSHLLPPKDELELARRFINMRHAERKQFLTQEIAQLLADPRTRKSVVENQDNFLKNVRATTFAQAFPEVILFPGAHRDRIKEFKKHLWPALAQSHSPSDERTQVLFDLYDSETPSTPEQRLYFDTLKSLAGSHDEALKKLLSTPELIKKLDQEGKIGTFLAGACSLRAVGVEARSLEKTLALESPYYLGDHIAHYPEEGSPLLEILQERPEKFVETAKLFEGKKNFLNLWKQNWLPYIDPQDPLRPKLLQVIETLEALPPSNTPPSYDCDGFF